MNKNFNQPRVSVSVIVPCYKSSDTLSRAVASIAYQTYLPKEVILIDDASPDEGKTLHLMHALLAEYADELNIKIVQLYQNQGAASARNAGWNVATQEYIAFLDSDDAWHPKKIEIQYNFMENHPNLALTGHGFKIISNKLQPKWSLGNFRFKFISKTRLLVSNQFVTPSVMIRREVAIRFDSKKRYVDDHLLWLRIMYSGLEIARVEQALVAIYKPMYGSSGLSANLWLMEKSELDNYETLFREEHINFFVFSFLTIYSLLKYYRRVVIVFVRQSVQFLKSKTTFLFDE